MGLRDEEGAAPVRFCWACAHHHRGRTCDQMVDQENQYARAGQPWTDFRAERAWGAIPCACNALNLYDG